MPKIIEPNFTAETKLLIFNGTGADELSDVIKRVAKYCKQHELSPDDVMSMTIGWDDLMNPMISICV